MEQRLGRKKKIRDERRKQESGIDQNEEIKTRNQREVNRIRKTR
jgi:hypothetical protein